MFKNDARLDYAARRSTFFSLLPIAAMALAVGIATPAFADLIGVALGYDGDVRIGGTTGIETHFAAPVFPPQPATLAVTNVLLPAPLQPARELHSTMTEFLGVFNGDFVQHVVVTIQATNPALSAFTNPIDTTLALPVRFDGTFYSDDLAAGQMLNLVGSGIEDGNDISPFPVPGSVMTSGVGTQADPWRVQIGIPSSLVNVNNGFVKVHLYYGTVPVPEPASWALLLIGGAALARGVRGRATPVIR